MREWGEDAALVPLLQQSKHSHYCPHGGDWGGDGTTIHEAGGAAAPCETGGTGGAQQKTTQGVSFISLRSPLSISALTASTDENETTNQTSGCLSFLFLLLPRTLPLFPLLPLALMLLVSAVLVLTVATAEFLNYGFRAQTSTTTTTASSTATTANTSLLSSSLEYSKSSSSFGNNSHGVEEIPSKAATTLTTMVVNSTNVGAGVPLLPPLVLGWTGYFGPHILVADMKGGANASVDCAFHCEYSDDRSRYDQKRSTVFIYHAQDLRDPRDVPHPKGYHLNVFYSLESPPHSSHGYKMLPPDFFNLTMSYRHDSDIWAAYDALEPISEGSASSDASSKSKMLERWTWEELEERVKKKSKLAAVFVSNCYTRSRRENYLRELRNYINVTQLGKCTGNYCPGDKCLEKELDSHLFYLAFENSVCRDYVTEKFWRAARNLVNTNSLIKLDFAVMWVGVYSFDSEERIFKVVPVVLSRQVFATLPPDCLPVYIAADDFSSPEQLAEHLLYLQRNRDEYLKLLEWGMKFKRKSQKRPDHLCRLCRMASERLQARVPNIVEFWEKGGSCQDEYGIRILPKTERHHSQQQHPSSPPQRLLRLFSKNISSSKGEASAALEIPY